MQKYFLSSLVRGALSLNRARGSTVRQFLGKSIVFPAQNISFKFSNTRNHEQEHIKERIGREASIFKALMNEGQSHMSRGRYDDAEQSFIKALEKSLQIFGEENQVTGITLYSLGNVMMLKGDKGRAKQVYERAIKILSKDPEKNKENLANIKKALYTIAGEGHTEAAQDISQKKEALLKELEEMKKSHNDEARFANIHAILGNIYLKEGNLQEALAYKQTALGLFEKLYKADPKSLFYVLNEHGNFLRDLKRFKDAIVMYFKSIDLIANDNSNTAEGMRFVAYHNLGRAYVLLKEHGEALDYFMKAIRIKEQRAFKDDVVLSSLYHEIGMVYFFLRRGREALEYFQKSLDLKEQLNDQVGASRLFQQMGECCLFILKDFETARSYFLQTLEIRKALYGNDHPEVKNVERALAFIDAKLQKVH